MAITLVSYAKKQPGTRYHADKKAWVGYRIDVRIGGRRLRNRRFPTQREAETYIEQLRSQRKYAGRGLRYQSPTDIKLRDLIERRTADIRDPKRENLVKRVLANFLAIVGENAQVVDVTYQHLKEYNRLRAGQITPARKTPVSDRTIDREMTEISSMLRSAGEHFEGLESYQPPKIPRLRIADIRRERVISKDEQRALIDHFARPRQPNESSGHYHDRITIGHAFEFALLTSSRRKEVVKLRKTDYYPAQDVLKITRWKTIRSKRQSVSVFSPVPKRVREILEMRRGIDPASEYFFSRSGADSQGYLKAMKRACRALGITYGRYTEGGLTFHDTRHTFVSTLLDGGTDIETTRDLAGLSRDMILRYAHASPASKRRAVAILDGRSTDAGIKNCLVKLYEKARLGEVECSAFVAEILSLWPQNGHESG